MAKKQKTGGRAKGVKNKRTLAKERLMKMAADDAVANGKDPMEAAALAAQIASGNVGVKNLMGLKLGKVILSEFANALAGMAASIQPATPQDLLGPKEAKFRAYVELTLYAAEKAAQYESPRLAAMMIGAAQTKKITVQGGLPAADAVPVELPTDMYEDSVKVPDGYSERRTDNNNPDVPPGAGKVLSGNERG